MGTRREPNSRPGSPTRHNPTLQDIPEANPGPNAFAQQATRMDQHRYNSNAFYQQQQDRRNNSVVSAIHPAYRHRAVSDRTPSKKSEGDGGDVRDSTMTTMSPFINAGRQPLQGQATSGSPELKLVPEGGEYAMPTRRGWIEERDEQAKHAASGAEDERTPVFHPTPKDNSNEFSKLPTPKKKTRHSEGGPTERPKSPKKGLLERFRMSNRGNTAPPTEPEENVPPKAQAVLGTSPSNASLTRSPSNKKKGIFSRKAVLGLDTHVNIAKASGLRNTKNTNVVVNESPVTAKSTNVPSTKTPQTASTDSPNTQSQDKRIISQTLSERGVDKQQHADACMVARSQSLNYFDRRIPPTPPAKNTPPEEKAKKEFESQSGRTPGKQGYQQAGDEDQTPSRRPVNAASEFDNSPGDIKFINASDRLSPTKYGSYGHRHEASIQKQASVRSFEAAVVTDPKGVKTFDQSTLPDVGGLGITNANFAMDNPGNNIYSPSIYQSNWQSESVTSSPNPNPLEGFLSKNRNSPEQQPKVLDRDDAHQKSSSNDSKETIEVCYPDLANDPNYLRQLRPQNPNHSTDSFWSNRISVVHDDTPSDTIKPQHGATHSRDHSKSPHHSMDTGIFARPIERPGNNMSPQSFHPSAMPSPLEFLPATTYVPGDQDRVSRKKGREETLDPQATPKAKVKVAKRSKNTRTIVKLGTMETPTKTKSHKTKTKTGPVPDGRRKIDMPETPVRPASPRNTEYIGGAVHENKEDFSFPTPRANVLANAPKLSHSRPTSPLRIVPPTQNLNVDPQKISPTTPIDETSDKLDTLLSMFHKLNTHILARDKDIADLRTEMRANHLELSDRLDIVERKQAEADRTRLEQQEEETAFAAAIESWNTANVRTSSLSAASYTTGGELRDDSHPVRQALLRAGAQRERGNVSPRELYQRHSVAPEYYTRSPDDKSQVSENSEASEASDSSDGRSEDEANIEHSAYYPPRNDSLRDPQPQQQQAQAASVEVSDSSSPAFTSTPSVSPDGSQQLQHPRQEVVPRLFFPPQEQQQGDNGGEVGGGNSDSEHRVNAMIEHFTRKLEDMERKIGSGQQRQHQQQQQQQQQNGSANRAAAGVEGGMF
ncbi:hypothetical protein MBLNU230_g4908t1 [Neophaeotheca triangularis]